MREFVIKEWNALGCARSRDPLPEEKAPAGAFHQLAAHEPIVIIDGPRSLDDIPKPRPAPAEDAPREAEAEPASDALEQRAASRPGRRRGGRNFVVAYEGRFVGVFEAEEELTPREAFLRVAGDLSGRQGFDPEKLQLYKPVLLQSARPSKGNKFVPGKLTEIGGRIHESSVHEGREKGAAEASVEQKACLEPA